MIIPFILAAVSGCMTAIGLVIFPELRTWFKGSLFFSNTFLCMMTAGKLIGRRGPAPGGYYLVPYASSAVPFAVIAAAHILSSNRKLENMYGPTVTIRQMVINGMLEGMFMLFFISLLILYTW